MVTTTEGTTKRVLPAHAGMIPPQPGELRYVERCSPLTRG